MYIFLLNKNAICLLSWSVPDLLMKKKTVLQVEMGAGSLCVWFASAWFTHSKNYCIKKKSQKPHDTDINCVMNAVTRKTILLL